MRASAPRTWVVELRPLPQGPLLVCPQCPSAPQALQGRSARATALAHLAQHARACPLPQHLRTCQCHERGCHWHPRHRGCAGPVLLVLARERGGRLWRLADACTACAHATADASVVPETRLARPSPLPRRVPVRHRRPCDVDASALLAGQMLSYLAASLPLHTTPEARLLALQAVLRATSSSAVRLRKGLVHGMGHGSMSSAWKELADSRFVTPALSADSLHTGRLTDSVTGMPSSAVRRQAADWALRTARQARARGLGPTGQLLSVGLHALTGPSRRDGSADTGHVARLCGLAASSLLHEFERLVATGMLMGWTLSSAEEQATWKLG